MKTDILNMKLFLRENRSQLDTHPVGNPPVLVDDPIYFSNGNIPTENGLFSYKFGKPGSNDRRQQFGYIDLRRKFLHPTYFKLFCSMSKDIEKILLSKEYYKVEDGKFIQDSDGETGPSFFYKHFSELKLENTGTQRRNTYLELLGVSSMEDIFVDKWTVIPPYLRDYNPNENDANEIKAVDQINDYYVKLIRYTNSLSSSSEFNFMEALTEASIQQLLQTTYEYCLFKLNKKTGMFHRSLMGKSIDYATRSVITAPRVNGNDVKDKQIKFGYLGVPLGQVMVLFYPFFINYIQNFVGEHVLELSNYKEKGKQVVISNVREQFSEEKIKKMMNLYIKSEESRFKTLKVKADDGKEYPFNLYRKDLGRNFTMTDLFYLAAIDIIRDKHIYCTRYPIEVYQNIFPAKITLLTTHKTTEVILGNKYLPDYPEIIPDYPTDGDEFVDSVRMFNAYLDAIGGDYDGDTVSLRAVFTHEANREAEKLIYSKKNFLGNSGNAIRPLGKEAVLAAYALTKDYIKPKYTDN